MRNRAEVHAADLAAAQRDGDRSDSGLRFAVDRVSLEVAVRVRREGTARTGLRTALPLPSRDAGLIERGLAPHLKPCADAVDGYRTV
ncbi:MAG TPA: trypco2 family protein [Streptomyces sp.]|nr:trypco2 family protein [Streptomyces sp.]